MHLKKFILLPMCALVLAGCAPTVIPPEDVEINASTTTLEIGDTLQLTSTVTPEGADATLTWATSDAEVATVSDAGLVTAVGVGTVDITLVATSEETVLKDEVTLTVNPDVEAVLASIANEIAVTGTSTLVSPDYGALGSFDFNTYLNVNEGKEQWYYSSEGSVYSYFANEEGYLVDYVLDNHNEVSEIQYTSGGEPVLADDYIAYSFNTITADEVTLTSPTQLDVAIGAEHGAVELASELSGYIADVTDTVTINLNKDGSVASLTVVGSGIVELELEDGSTVNANYTNTVVANVTTKEAIGAPRRDPNPAITGDDAAIVNSFLTGLENENYTLDIVDGGESMGEVIVTPEGIAMPEATYALVEGQGVFQVTVDEEANTITANSQSPLAPAISDMLNPVDFSADLFTPLGNGVYRLAGGLTDNLLLGLDPALAFIGSYYMIMNISSVEVVLTTEGTTVTGATLSYEYDYYGFGLIIGELTINISNIGSSVFPYADATFVEYAPEAWSEVSGQTGWYDSAVAYLGEDVDNVPFIAADWFGYADTIYYEFGVQASFETLAEAEALSNEYIEVLGAAGWTIVPDITDGYGASVYSDNVSTIYVSTSAWEASSGEFVCDIIFWASEDLIPATMWSEVDAEWAASVNEALGGNIDSVPFIDLDWTVYNDSYYGILAESAYLDSFATAQALAAEMVDALTTAGWSLDEGLEDSNGYQVYTLPGNPIAVAVNPVNLFDVYYYVEVAFSAYSDATVPTVATTWSEYDADFAAAMETAGIDVDVVPFLDAEWACDSSTTSAYFYGTEAEATEMHTAYVALLTEAGWTTDGATDANGATIYTNPETNVTIAVQLDVRTASVAYVNLFFGVAAGE